MRNAINMAIVALMVLTAVSCSAQNLTTLRSGGKEHHITRVIKGGTVAVGDGSTLVFEKGGKIVGATVTGKNMRVVPNGTAVAFERCSFAGSLVNSKLSATNFGLVADMKSSSYSFTSKGKKFSTRRRSGTDNAVAWKSLAQFLSGSNNVSVNFNGEFYNTPSTLFVYINGARNLELTGGTVIMGLRIYNSSNVNVHDMKFVGYHEAHDFPPLYSSQPAAVNGTGYTTANSFGMTKDGIANIGIADDALRFEIDADGKTSSNIAVSRCHFEMRQDGLVAGQRSTRRVLSNVKCTDCTASHILYQPVALRCSGAVVNNMVADYCLQGVDMSTCSNNVTVTNSRFTRCYTGPKQETYGEFKTMTHNNSLDNCYFQMTDDYLLVDGSQTILSVAEGAKGDVFKVSNTTFEVKKNRAFGPVVCRAAGVEMDNVTFNIDLPLNSRGTDKWSMVEVFAVYGSTDSKPHYRLNNVTLNMSSNTRVYDIFSPHVSNVEMNVTATGLKVQGGQGNLDCYFNNIAGVELNDCSFTPAASVVAQGVTTMQAQGCNFTGNNTQFFKSTARNSTLKLSGNTIKAATMVNYSASAPKLVEMQNNNVTLTGAEAFTGVTRGSSLKSSNFKVSGNTFQCTNRSARLLPTDAQSKFSSLVKNNVVR